MSHPNFAKILFYLMSKGSLKLNIAEENMGFDNIDYKKSLQNDYSKENCVFQHFTKRLSINKLKIIRLMQSSETCSEYEYTREIKGVATNIRRRTDTVFASPNALYDLRHQLISVGIKYYSQIEQGKKEGIYHMRLVESSI